jgi:hypothetical protein
VTVDGEIIEVEDQPEDPEYTTIQELSDNSHFTWYGDWPATGLDCIQNCRERDFYMSMIYYGDEEGYWTNKKYCFCYDI